jgi:RHS repeat-associated protein
MHLFKPMYLRFGECRNSQGNPGTDKLFTGQRLDGTGLYYYGARYYDASMGRFISADTIVQSPGNPQTLNRYSYCLNNPLAYIDPTGKYFEAENEAAALEWCRLNMEFRLEVPSWITEWAYKRCAIDDAYNAIMNNADIPGGIKHYMRILHDSDRVIHINFGDFGGGAVAINAMQIYSRFDRTIDFATEDYICIDSEWLSNLAPIFAHECYHIYEGNPGGTAEEEFVAYAVQFFVERALSGSSSWGWIFEIESLRDFPKGFKRELRERTGSPLYGVMPLYQSQMSTASVIKQGLVAGGMQQWWVTPLSYALSTNFTIRGIPWE